MEKTDSLFASKVQNIDGSTKLISFASILKEKITKKTVNLVALTYDEIRLAFLIVENYVKNAWAKYGIERVMLNMRFFFFQFSTKEGMDKVIEKGPWALIEVSLETALMDSLVVDIPFQDGSGHTMKTIDIDYEWYPPRCDSCKIFDHNDDQCPKKVKVVVPNHVLDDGFVEVNRKHGKGKQNSKPRHIDVARLTKPKPNNYYRHVSKPVNVNGEASISQPKENKEPSALKTNNTDKNFDVNNEPWKATNDIGSKMDDSDSEEVKNVFVEDKGKHMDDLVDDAQNKVEAPHKKTPRKTDLEKLQRRISVFRCNSIWGCYRLVSRAKQSCQLILQLPILLFTLGYDNGVSNYGILRGGCQTVTREGTRSLEYVPNPMELEDHVPVRGYYLLLPDLGVRLGESSVAATARQPGPTMARRVDCSSVDTMETRVRDTERRMLVALEVVNLRISYQVDVRSRENSEFYSRHHDAQKDRAAMRAEEFELF
ncbi:zinc knuckle CX2CX4HX4C containing protein [Tanacetum coccineum]